MICLKPPWNAQPQVAAQVDWGNPLSNGLIFAWTASKSLTNAVPGINQVDFINGVYYFDTPRNRGIVRKTSANGTIEQRFRFLRSIPASTPLTYGAAFRLVVRHGEGQFVLTNDSFAAHFIRINTSLKVEGGANTFIANSLVTSDNAYSSGDWLYIVMTAKSGAWTMYVNGVKQSTVNTGGLAGQPLNRVDINGSGLEFLTAFAAQGVWNDSQVESWTQNPWQIFKKDTKPLFFVSTNAAYSLTADSGAYNLTGSAAELLRTRDLSADSGAYNVTGADATFVRGKFLSADSGQYSFVGSDATLNRGINVSADTGQYNLTGAAATLFRSLGLSADSGSYQVDGKDATFLTGKALSADSGSYQIGGQAAEFARTYSFPANVGSFNLTGSAATLVASRLLSADSGSYDITGSSASLIKFSVYPDPSDVRAGVTYGPGGIYVGTLTVGGKVLYIFDD